MNKSVTFTVKIRTLVLAAMAFIAVVGISQTLIARNMSKTATTSDATIVYRVNKSEVVGAVTMNGKIYVVHIENDNPYYQEATKR